MNTNRGGRELKVRVKGAKSLSSKLWLERQLSLGDRPTVGQQATVKRWGVGDAIRDWQTCLAKEGEAGIEERLLGSGGDDDVRRRDRFASTGGTRVKARWPQDQPAPSAKRDSGRIRWLIDG